MIRSLRLFSVPLLVFLLSVALISCDLLGLTEEDENGDGGGSFGPPSASAMDYLGLSYYGEYHGNGGYNTDVFITSVASGGSDYFYFELNDNSNSIDIDTGIYTADTSGSPGSMSFTDVARGATESGADYYASPYPENDLNFDIGTYEQLSGGSLQVSRSGDVYTFEWTLEKSGGGTISGSYSGSVNEESDETAEASSASRLSLGIAGAARSALKDSAARNEWGSK